MKCFWRVLVQTLGTSLMNELHRLLLEACVVTDAVPDLPCCGFVVLLLPTTCAGFVIARELRVECDPFSGDSSIPDISATAPYQKRKGRNLLQVHPPNFVPGEKEKRPKMAWLRPPRQHTVPIR